MYPNLYTLILLCGIGSLVNTFLVCLFTDHRILYHHYQPPYTMILASAQIHPHRGDIGKNIADHCALIHEAAQYDVDLILFPELSLTGYEREEAPFLAFLPKDSRLKPFRQLARQYQMIIVVGAPILDDDRLFIGAFIIHPNGRVEYYTKQYLHDGEEEFFQPSFEYNPVIHLNNEQAQVAICADISNPEHSKAAAQSSIYLASIFYTPNGLPEAHTDLSTYAQQHQMNVLMANFCGESWGIDAAGQSAFWSNTGELIGQLDATTAGLLIVEKKEAGWRVKNEMCVEGY